MAIHYPNGKKFIEHQALAKAKKVKQTTYGNRGMTLEEDLNITNKYYRDHEIALIHKKPTPLQIVNVEYPKRSAAKITEAYFKKPSTTDYNGVYKGKYIDFEAKETQNKTALPMQNFHDHQIEHMRQVKQHNGIAFIIVKFSNVNEVYFLDSEFLLQYWWEQINGGRKSIPKEVFENKGYLIKNSYRPRLDYIQIIDKIYL
ncbi:recombination protein U [Pullulanibacillus pueri]|uniref:Holliday junction resolvase RecU n=1 Tax=Pullulanibacillus pueri TaxID=1437324 RepID=A0A8J2ZUH2_9BACL|nr:Holliday junction resolvase RecU [Pullulanibacillus pueri]MBM7681427.1 recombination protein U [Pullulanibacillus pueri]GGH78834.1 Holliday junction resolvase RecU [Pullulanibacillus pueri]